MTENKPTGIAIEFDLYCIAGQKQLFPFVHRILIFYTQKILRLKYSLDDMLLDFRIQVVCH